MSSTTRTISTSNPSQPTTNTLTPSTKHYSIKTNTSHEPKARTIRSKDAHLGIPIVGYGPAFGRPEPTLRAVDLAKIVPGRSRC